MFLTFQVSRSGVLPRLGVAQEWPGLGLALASSAILGTAAVGLREWFFLEQSQESENQEASRLGKKTQEALLVVRGGGGSCSWLTATLSPGCH